MPHSLWLNAETHALGSKYTNDIFKANDTPNVFGSPPFLYMHHSFHWFSLGTKLTTAKLVCPEPGCHSSLMFDTRKQKQYHFLTFDF